MKYIYLVVLIIGGLVKGNSQTPEPYFLYFYEWGIGGPSSLNFKVDQITSIDIEKDGYLIKLGTLCIDGILCQRYQKIDFEGNVKWNYDFNDKDTSYLGTPNNQENWIIENRFYTLSKVVLPDNEEEYQYIIFDINSGQIDFQKSYKDSDINMGGLSFFSPYKDSLFVFGQSHIVDQGRNVPAFRIINREGEIVRSVDAHSYFANNTTLTTNFEENASGDFNIITVQRDYFSTTAGFLYAGICSRDGNKLTHFATGDHTVGGYPREITFANGNRFLVASIDTLWDDIFAKSILFKTYYLKPNGEVIKDSLYHHGDTIYALSDVILCNNGDALIAGIAKVELELEDDNNELFIIRVNPQGETVWHKKYSPYLFGPNNLNRMQVLQIEEDWDNGILVTGNMSRITDPLTNERERNAFLLKLDQNGCYGADCNGGNILLSTKAPIPITPLPEVNIYPNPATDRLQITTASNEDYDWRLFDTQGRLIREGVGDYQNSTSINTESIHNGTYFLQIRFAKGVVNKQVLILR